MSSITNIMGCESLLPFEPIALFLSPEHRMLQVSFELNPASVDSLCNFKIKQLRQVRKYKLL